jgi:hypothetical protein
MLAYTGLRKFFMFSTGTYQNLNITFESDEIADAITSHVCTSTITLPHFESFNLMKAAMDAVLNDVNTYNII